MREDKISIEDTFKSSVRKDINVYRGVIKIDHMNRCKENNEDYYYIDTGYLGNFPSPGNLGGKKIWHRIVKNEMQLSKLRSVPDDRWKKLLAQDPRLEFKGRKNYDKKILLVMPNPKACKAYNIDYDTWCEQTTNDIKKYTNLPVEIRIKGSRSERNHGYSIYDAFDSGVYATVSLNSIASLESVLYGIPSFVSVPCSATPLANTDLSKLNDPFFPSNDIIEQHCRSLAYGQFTMEEITNGTAWNILEKY
jgi:hypothetical protein